MYCKGYKYIKKPNHPYSTSRGYVLEHRLIMEDEIGRYLKPNEIVHHKDGNRLNNNINNLELLSNLSKHRNLHESSKIYYLDKYYDYIIKRYSEGAGCSIIASEINSNKTSVLKWLRKNNIKLRKQKLKVVCKTGFKWCNSCKQELKIKLFYKNKNTYDGLRNRCIDCTKKEAKKYYKKDV